MNWTAYTSTQIVAVAGPHGDAVGGGEILWIAGAVLMCLGIALLAMWGFGGGPMPWLDVAAFGLFVFGAGVSGVLPR